MRRLADSTADFELRALGTERTTFYALLAWEPWLGSTMGVMHDPLDSLMILRTATTPRLDKSVPISAT